MDDYISREAMHKANQDEWEGVYGQIDCDIFEDNEDMIDRVPTADVVARDCYDRILAENDTMRKQLAQIGKKPGDKMEDVRPVVRCRDCRWWTKQEKSLQGRCELGGFYPTGEWFCANGERHNCGADMREPNLDTTKGDNHD